MLSTLLEAVNSTITSDSASLNSSIFPLILSHPILLTFLIGAFLAVVVPQLIDISRRQPNEPPLVSSLLPLLGSTISFSKNPYQFLSQCRNQYGEIFTVNLAGRRMHFLCDPLSYSSLFKNKSLSFDLVADEISASVLTQRKSSIGEPNIRKLVHQQYIKHLQSNDGLLELTVNSYKETRRWILQDYQLKQHQRVSIGLNQWMQQMIFYAGAKSIYGYGLNGDQLQEQFSAFDQSFSMFISGVPTFLLRKACKARSQLIQRFGTVEAREGEAAIISARRQMFAANSDIYNLHDVGAIQMAILWAAVANTIPATFWTLAYLLTHREAFDAVKQEVNSVLPRLSLNAGEAENNDCWTPDQCSQLKITDSAIMESLRLATGSMILRRAISATILTLHDGRTVAIREGDSVALYPSLTHLDSRVFPNANEYHYDRFLADSPNSLLVNGEKKLLNGFLPFGAGVSMCPGRYWAKNEILVAVAMIIQNCEITVEPNAKVPGFDYSRVGIGVFPPKGDINITYKYI